MEEGAGYIEFEVRRSFGAFGEVSVTLATQEGTAVSTEGTSLALDTIQPIESTSAEKWYQFSVDGRPYLALASSSVSGGSMLYSRRGVFTPVQVRDWPSSAGAWLSYFRTRNKFTRHYYTSMLTTNYSLENKCLCDLTKGREEIWSGPFNLVYG